MDFLRKLFKPRQWDQVSERDPLFHCENCTVQSNKLTTWEGFLICKECEEAEIRRARLKQADEEWEALEKKPQE